MVTPFSKVIVPLCILLVVSVLMSGCFQPKVPVTVSRSSAIPADAVKMGPETDTLAPVVHDDLWQKPVPMAGPVNTAGAEDSPFMTPDGNSFYFFFTPDVTVPAEKQLLDGVTGIWRTKQVDGSWTEPERVILCDDVALDGCECIQGDILWFASIRAGNIGDIDVYAARDENGKWARWTNAGEQLNRQYDIGEFHVTPDGNTIYFGWKANGTTDSGNIWEGNRDIYRSEKINGQWGQPVSLGPNVNSAGMEDQPFISPDGNELWFTGQSRLGYPGPSVFRSVKGPDGEWGKAEEIVSNFAGEPTLDASGNLYFVHHYYSNDAMIEADIYVAKRL